MKKFLVPLCALIISAAAVTSYGYSATPTITGTYYCTNISNHRCWFQGAAYSNWTCWSAVHNAPWPLHSDWQSMHNSSPICCNFTPGDWWNYNGYNYQIWQLKRSWCTDHWVSPTCSAMTSRMRATCSNNI